MTDGAPSFFAQAIFETEHAGRHIATLCRHFASKVEATFTQQAGRVVFPFGACDFTASERQLIFLASAADTGCLGQVTDVVTRHFERFAFRERPDLAWHPLADAPSP